MKVFDGLSVQKNITKLKNYLALQSLDYERNIWWLFQNGIVCPKLYSVLRNKLGSFEPSKFGIHVFIISMKKMRLIWVACSPLV